MFTIQTEGVAAKDNTVAIAQRTWQLQKTRFRSTLAGSTVTVRGHLMTSFRSASARMLWDSSTPAEHSAEDRIRNRLHSGRNDMIDTRGKSMQNSNIRRDLIRE